MRRLVFDRAAVADLDAIGDFIAKDDPSRALSYVEGVLAQCRVLCEFPYLGPARDSLGRGIRVLPYRRRVVVAYRVFADTVRVVRVYYAGRDR